MDEPSHLRRPTLAPRTRGTIGFAAGLAAIFGAGVVTTIATRPAKPPVIEVAAPSPLTAVVPFVVPSVLVLSAPAPAPAPEPIPEPVAVAPRALAPTINAACLLRAKDDIQCGWDAGFPAISADGELIATRNFGEDGGRGYPGLSIVLVGAKTARHVKSYLVMSPDEYLEDLGHEGWPKLRAKIAKREATAQRALDARRFRALRAIAVRDLRPGNESEGEITSTTDLSLRGERDGDAIRLIDRATNTVVWQRRFPVEAVYPEANNPRPDGDSCYPSSTSSIEILWDPPTRTVVANVGYAAGPCYCDGAGATYVTRI